MESRMTTRVVRTSNAEGGSGVETKFEAFQSVLRRLGNSQGSSASSYSSRTTSSAAESVAAYSQLCDRLWPIKRFIIGRTEPSRMVSWTSIHRWYLVGLLSHPKNFYCHRTRFDANLSRVSLLRTNRRSAEPCSGSSETDQPESQRE